MTSAEEKLVEITGILLNIFIFALGAGFMEIILAGSNHLEGNPTAPLIGSVIMMVVSVIAGTMRIRNFRQMLKGELLSKPDFTTSVMTLIGLVIGGTGIGLYFLVASESPSGGDITSNDLKGIVLAVGIIYGVAYEIVIRRVKGSQTATVTNSGGSGK